MGEKFFSPEVVPGAGRWSERRPPWLDLCAMKLVLFDFDGTLTALDTTLPLGRHFAGATAGRAALARLGVALVLARFRLMSNTGLKKIFARQFLRGRSGPAVRELALAFWRSHLDSLAEPAVLDSLRAHVRNGDRVYLISANFDCLLEPLVDLWSVAGVIGTRAEITGGVYTGRLAGAACHGNGKLDRALAQVGAADLQSAIAYGNHDDLPLLRRVQQGFLVRRAASAGLFSRLRRLRGILAGKPAATGGPSACIITPLTPVLTSRPSV